MSKRDEAKLELLEDVREDSVRDLLEPFAGFVGAPLADFLEED